MTLASQAAAAGGAPLRLPPSQVQAGDQPVAGLVRFLVRRIVSSLVTLLGISTVTFVIVRLLGNPVYLLVGQDVNQQIIDDMTKAMGLDQPIWVQYAKYLWAVAHGDFGISRVTFQPVTVELAQRLPATVELVLASMLIVVCLAIPLGMAAAISQGGAIDRLSQYLVEFSISVPAFWFGLILVFVFFAALNWLPAPLGRLDGGDPPPPGPTGLYTVDAILSGRATTFVDAVRHLVLPACALALSHIPTTLQITRTSMIQVLDSRYIRTARALGLSNRRIYTRYALKNILLPLFTVLAMTFGSLMSTTVLIEVVFSWPGIGLYAVNAMNAFDYAPIQAVVLLAATIYIGAYFIADVVSALIDPRVRL